MCSFQPFFADCLGLGLGFFVRVSLFIFQMIGKTWWYCAPFITEGQTFKWKNYPRYHFWKKEEKKMVAWSRFR